MLSSRYCSGDPPRGMGSPGSAQRKPVCPMGHPVLGGTASSSQSPPSQLTTTALPLTWASPCCVVCLADAMAEPQVLEGLEEELTCSVCLDIYRNPVSLGCGHSFCEECIQGVLRSQHCPQGLFSCPLCSTLEAPPTKLQPNIQLRSIVQKFLDTSEQSAALEEELRRQVECEEKGESSYFHDEEILCDFCLENPQPAVKTCMNCETSLCQAHLGKHSTKAFLTSHVLVEPCDARVLAERRCSQHGKLLECYCVTDSVCVCMLCCATSSHRSHEIISVEEAFSQAQVRGCQDSCLDWDCSRENLGLWDMERCPKREARTSPGLQVCRLPPWDTWLWVWALPQPVPGPAPWAVKQSHEQSVGPSACGFAFSPRCIFEQEHQPQLCLCNEN